MTTQHSAAALKMFSSNSMQAPLRELLPQFERTSGCKVSVVFDTAKLTLDRIRAGETADLVILNVESLEELEKLGKVPSGGCTRIARNAAGVAVLAGAPKPDISTVDAFKRALLDARAIAYTGAGASGMYFAKLIKRLGIAKEVEAKAKVRPGGLIGELVASGEADIAIQQIPELLAVPGIELVGPLPQDIQISGTLAVSLFNGTDQPQAARSLIDFLASPQSARVYQARGFGLP